MANKQTIAYDNTLQIGFPAGHYSHICTAGNFAFISGLLPSSAEEGIMAHAAFAVQVNQTLQNLEYCLLQAALERRHLVQVRIYLAQISNWPEFNTLYAHWMGEYKPARVIVGVSELHYGVQLEIEATALIPDDLTNKPEITHE